MSGEAGFTSQQQQPSPWALGGGFGGGGHFGELGDAGVGQGFQAGGGHFGELGDASPWLTGGGFGGQWSEHEGGSGQKGEGQGQERTLNPDKQGSPAIKEAVGNAASGKDAKGGKPDQAILTPQQIEQQFKEGKGQDFERAKALGMNAEQYKQEYVHEYMARLCQTDPFVKDKDGKPVVGKDGNPVSNYSAAQQNSLSAWGYNPKVDPSNVVDHNKDTGLFAIRFEPSAQGAKNGTAPVVAFRGTEPDRGPRDAQADLGDKYIGQSEYEPGKAEIAKLFGHKPGEKADVVGYSLGGALAQRSLVDNAQNVRSLSTFQSPGIAGQDAAAVNAAEKKYGIDVNHHFFTNDIVHRAGEAKVDGNYHEYTRGDWATGLNTGDAHLSSFLIPSDGAKGTIDAHGKVKDKDGYANATNQNTTIQNYQGDRQSDRAFWEAQRRTLGPAASGLLGEVGAGMDLWQKTDSEWNPVLGKDGKPIPGPLQNAVNQTKGGWGETKDGWSGVKSGATEAGHGVSDLLHGNFGKGLSELGHGLSSGWSGAKEMGKGAQDMWSGVKNGASTLGNFFHDHIAPHGGDLKQIASGLPGIVNHLAHDPSVQKKVAEMAAPITKPIGAAIDKAKSIGGAISNGVSSAWDGAKSTASKVGTGISNGVNSAVGTAKNVANNVGSAISNGWNWLTGKKK